MELLLLRYGELWLKSPQVQRRFMDRLLSNIQEHFRADGIPARVTRSRDRFFAEVEAKNLLRAKDILSHTFGLVSFSHVSKITSDRQEIFNEVLRAAKKNICPKDTFAIRAQRTGKHGYTSNELEREAGALVVEHLGNKVNLTRPDRTVYIDVRDNDAYVFSEKLPAAGGLPLGVEGKAVLEFSRDLERDLAAAYIMMKRGCRILPVFAKSGKGSKEALEFLKKFDPNAKPYFSGRKKIDAFALEICLKKGAEAIVLSAGAKELCSEKHPKTFDKKASIPYLYPLVGHTSGEIRALFETVK